MNRQQRPYILCLVMGLLFGVQLSAQAPQWRVVFGTLHSHSGVSDGKGTPEEAFKHAKEHVNFLCLSEHNHMSNAAELEQVRSAANSSTAGDFVGIVGQEFSTISGGNHVNVYNVHVPIPASLNKNYKGLFEQWLPDFVEKNGSPLVVAQFNHPARTSEDYGIARKGEFANYDGDWSEFVRRVDPWVSLIAVVSGPADSSGPQSPPTNVHRDATGTFLNAWKHYLDKGFHLSPVADQDNHRKTWGNRTTARTGVWIDGTLTRDRLLTALRNGQAYATEDPNLSLWFGVGDSVMGSRMPEPVDGGDVRFQVKVIDSDEPSSMYRISLFHDLVGDGEQPEIQTESEPVQSGETWETTEVHTSGRHELFFVQVSQVSSTGPRDDAWSAPIWIDPGIAPGGEDHPDPENSPAIPATSTPRFSWSQSSNVYHFTECIVVSRIASHNLRRGDEPPNGKRLHHNCPQE